MQFGCIGGPAGTRGACGGYGASIDSVRMPGTCPPGCVPDLQYFRGKVPLTQHMAGYGAMIDTPPVEGWVLQSFTGTQAFPTMEAAEAASDAVLEELIASGKVVTDAFQVAQLNILQAAGGYVVQVEYWVAPEFAELRKKLIWPWVVGGAVVLAGTVGGIAWWATKGKRRRRARRR